MRILFIGDIFGRPGRPIVREELPLLVAEHRADRIIANGGSSAAGFGISPALAEELFEMGIDVITTGNHVWDKREIYDYLQAENGNQHSMARRILRPANFPAELPGTGWYEGSKHNVPYAVINLQGRRIMGFRDGPLGVAARLFGKKKSKIRSVSPHSG